MLSKRSMFDNDSLGFVSSAYHFFFQLAEKTNPFVNAAKVHVNILYDYKLSINRHLFLTNIVD